MDSYSTERMAADINLISRFLAVRDVESLETERPVEVLLLFGGSIPHGIDRAAEAYLRGAAERFMIVGGIGHTTEGLRRAIGARYPGIATGGRAEADIIADYLAEHRGIAREKLLIENRSANCGENIAFAQAVLKGKNIRPESVLLMQDSSMQRRMDATMRRVWAYDVRIVNYAAYRVDVVVRDGALAFEQNDIWGLWDMERFIALQMSEIPRLRDDENGYGPRGRGFIAHVEIPGEVEEAFARLEGEYGGLLRCT